MTLNKLKVAELRAKAEEAGVEGWETLDRKGLLAALEPTTASPEAVSPPQAELEAEEAEEAAPQAETPAPPKNVLPLGSKARQMRDKLHAEDKVRVFIPLANGEKQGVTQSVILNGYPMYIRKGQYVDVPESVADVLEIKLKHKMLVENHPSRLGGDGDIKMTKFGN